VECGSHASDIAEPPFRFAPRLFRRHAAIDQLACPHFEVEGELLVDFFRDARAPEDPVERVHGVTRTFEMAAAKRAQSAVCVVS
jgi:hypothetical protein